MLKTGLLTRSADLQQKQYYDMAGPETQDQKNLLDLGRICTV